MPNLKTFDVAPFIQQNITGIKIEKQFIIIAFTNEVNIYYYSLRKIYKTLESVKENRDSKLLASTKLQDNLDTIKNKITECILNYNEEMVLYSYQV